MERFRFWSHGAQLLAWSTDHDILETFVSSLVVDNDCVFRDVVDIQVLHRRRGICLWIHLCGLLVVFQLRGFGEVD